MTQIKNRSLHVAVGDVGPLENLKYFSEAVIASRVLQQRPRNDAVTHRDQGEAIRNIGFQLAGQGDAWDQTWKRP